MTRVPVRAVTFDYWNTIIRANGDPAGARAQVWTRLLDEAGMPQPPELVRAAFDAEWAEHHAAWHRNDQYTGEMAARGAIERLGLPIGNELAEALVEGFAAAATELYTPCPGVIEALHALHDSGIRLGIICDVGFTPSTRLRALLDDLGVLGLFSGWSFSDEVGCYKPAAEIFEHALGYLGTAASDTAHIGDLRRTDIAGARAMGMTALRYTAVNDDDSDGPEGDAVVTDYALLSEILEPA